MLTDAKRIGMLSFRSVAEFGYKKDAFFGGIPKSVGPRPLRRGR